MVDPFNSVVTGSTDGIGKAYARELASHGVNIVLISRSEDKLKRVAKDIGKFRDEATCFAERQTRMITLMMMMVNSWK